MYVCVFFFQAEDGIRDLVRSRGLGDVYKRQIHLKVQAPGGPIITSQLFFPGVANNDADGIFNEKMLLAVQETSDGLTATFDFVVNTK